MTPDQPVSAPAAKPASSSTLFVLSLSIVLAAGMVVARCKVIDYPLSTPYTETVTSPNGFTRGQLVRIIQEAYHKIYTEEEF